MKAIFLILDKASFRNTMHLRGFFFCMIKENFYCWCDMGIQKAKTQTSAQEFDCDNLNFWVVCWPFFFYFFFSLYFPQKVECSSCLQGLMLSDCHPGSSKYICMDGLSGTVFASHRGCLICLVWHCYGLRGTTVVFPIMLEAMFSLKKSDNRI